MDLPESPPALPVPKKIRPLRVLLDVGITYGLSFFSGFIIGFASAIMNRPTSLIAIAVSNVVCCTVGFTIAGYFTTRNRWTHLLLVAAGLWLAGLVNLLFGVTFAQWVLSVLFILFSMGVGGGLASLFKRKEA